MFTNYRNLTVNHNIKFDLLMPVFNFKVKKSAYQLIYFKIIKFKYNFVSIIEHNISNNIFNIYVKYHKYFTLLIYMIVNSRNMCLRFYFNNICFLCSFIYKGDFNSIIQNCRDED